MKSFQVIVCAAILALAGCSEAKKATPVPIEDVPADVIAVAKEKLPNIEFDQAIQRADGSYEVRGKDAEGKVRDIDISATGEVISIE